MKFIKLEGSVYFKMTVTILNQCNNQEFLEFVRINGLLKYNLAKTSGKLKIPDIEIVRIARNQNGTIIGGASGSTYLSSLEVEVMWVNEDYIFKKQL